MIDFVQIVVGKILVIGAFAGAQNVFIQKMMGRLFQRSQRRLRLRTDLKTRFVSIGNWLGVAAGTVPAVIRTENLIVPDATLTRIGDDSLRIQDPASQAGSYQCADGSAVPGISAHGRKMEAGQPVGSRAG